VVWLNYSLAWGGSFDKLNNVHNLDGLDISADLLQPIRFQGQFFDTETSLHYNRFRYYDSDVGMFVSRDPIGLNGGLNTFQYGLNPIGWIDPFGLISIHDIALNKAKQLKISQGINDATKISVVRDKITGKTYTGISGNPYQKISKGLERYLPTKSRTDWKVKNCAEVDALNKAFKARPGANMKDMKIVTITIRNNTNKEPCGNCSITTRNASVEKFKYEVEDVENFSGCNH
jgi:RHS repeat-associated protein